MQAISQIIYFLFLISILKLLAQKVKSYFQDTNDFFKKIANLPTLPYDLVLCAIYFMKKG